MVLFNECQSINNSIPCSKLDIEERGLAHRGVYAEPSVVTPSFGAHGEEETPVLIPNTEVKLLSGDNTAQVGI